MAKPFSIQELRFSAESSFAENINSVTSNTYTTRLPLQGLANVTLTQSKIPDASIENYLNERRPGFNGIREADLEFTTFAAGHGTATTGALTENWLYTLLSKGLGTGDSGSSGSTVNAATDADTFTTVANPADFAAGSVMRVGAKTDARAKGAAAVVSSVSGTTVELLTALPAAPANADVVYATLMVYPDSDGFTDQGGTTRTLRFIASNLDTGAQWHMVGCQLVGLSVNIDIGSIPTITWRYKCAYWERGADTTPSAVAMAAQLAGPWAGADLFYQTVGTTTRSTITTHGMTLDIDLGTIEHRTNDGAAVYQTLTGFTRTHCRANLTIRCMLDTAYETLFDSDGTSATHKHVLAQSSTADGRVFGFYMPRTYIMGNRPSREDVDGLTGVSFTLCSREGATTTNDLTRSPIRFFIG